MSKKVEKEVKNEIGNVADFEKEEKSLSVSEKFYNLDAKIKLAGRTAAENICILGQALNEMKESKVYRETFGTFEDYCGSIGMTSRNANRYINIYVGLGEKATALADVGIAKLEMLSDASPEVKEVYIDRTVEVESTPVVELKRQIAELEQIKDELYEESLKKAQTTVSQDKYSAAVSEKERFEKQVSQLKEELKKIKDKSLDTEDAKVKELLKAKESLAGDNDVLRGKVEELEGKLKLSDQQTIIFKTKFDTFQTLTIELKDMLLKFDAAKRAGLIKALTAVCENLIKGV